MNIVEIIGIVVFVGIVFLVVCAGYALKDFPVSAEDDLETRTRIANDWHDPI